MSSEYIASPGDRILVTGSNGFIGSKVVEKLLEYGFANLRCFVRPSSRLSRLKEALDRLPAGRNVELVIGDLLSRDDCRKAAEGVSIIYHLAAGMEKSFAGAFMNSALATRNLMDAFLQFGEPKRFVNISSFAVYSNLGLRRGALVREYGKKYKLPYVILRPGYVFGPGKRELNGRVGINTFGFFIQVDGSHLLPLTFVDNCAEAIVLAGLKAGVDGEVFNVVDDDLLTSRQFLRLYKKRVNRFSARIPYFVADVLSLLWEKYSNSSQGQLPPVFNRRRCSAEWKGNRYSNEKLKQRLDWKPQVPMKEAMALFLQQFESNSNRG